MDSKKKWRDKNKSKIATYNRNYYLKNKGKLLSNRKSSNNSESRKIYMREYMRKKYRMDSLFREWKKEKSREYRLKNKDYIKKYNHLYYLRKKSLKQ